MKLSPAFFALGALLVTSGVDAARIPVLHPPVLPSASRVPPTITQVVPNTAFAGGSKFSIVVNGSRFAPATKVRWNGTELDTHWVSMRKLVASVPASDISNTGTASITLADAVGVSSAVTFTIVNPVPVLSTVWPPAFEVYQGSTTLWLTGSGFAPDATVYWNGTALSTQYTSQYSLTATAPASLFATVPSGMPVVTVGNPSPGGGVSNGFSVTENCNIPSSVVPSLDLTDGAADQSVQVFVLGIIPAESLSAQWNGSPLTIQSVSSNPYTTALTILIPAADIEAGGTGEITVVDGCGTSAPIAVHIAIPTPVLTSAGPDAAFGIVGGSGVTLTLMGSNFLPGVTVSVDGSPRATAYVSDTEVTIPLTAADVAAVGAHVLTAINTGTGAKASTAYFYTVGYSVNALSPEVFDIAWDATNQVLYASSGYWTANPDSLLIIDPTSRNVTNTLSTSSPPDILSISDDDSYLYVGFGQLPGDNPNPATIQRYSLPGLVPDIGWTVGAQGNFAQAIAVAPGAPHTVAVVRDLTGDVLVYDDGVSRPDTVARLFLNSSISFYEDIAWSADAKTLYSGDYTYSNSLYKFDVNSSGVTFDTKYKGILPQDWNIYGIHSDALTGYVFTDDGVVIDPTSGTVVTTLTTPVTSQRAEGIVLDDAAGKVYAAFPGGSPTYGEISIVSYDLTTLTITNTATVFTDYPTANTHLTRWGTHGLAFIDGSHRILILQGDFVN